MISSSRASYSRRSKLIMNRYYTIVILAIVCVSMHAVPVRREGRVMTDAEGVEKIVYPHGNEDFHYLTDAEGNWLDTRTLLPMPEEEKQKKIQLRNERAVRRAMQTTGVDRLLAPRGPVILVSFSDTLFRDTQEGMIEWAMGENYTYNGATGSIHQYFQDMSGGQYNLQLDVIGPVQVSKGAAYYGSNNSSGDDLHPDEMVKEACQLAAEQGMDFSQYDSDNDGNVDFVVILYAGYGEADNYPNMPKTIWPHQDDLSRISSTIQLNGKTIDHYCCLNEIDADSNDRCGIGTFCHEFGHIMGLPDLYPTGQSNSHKTLGEWDIMDYGCYNNGGNTPPAYSAYERWWMGWMEPRLLNSAISVTMNPLYPDGNAAYITESGASIPDILRPNPTVFYTIENRQKEGWDAYLPGHGLLITKINFHYNWWVYNQVNNSSTNMGVDIIEADGLTPSRDVYHRNNGFLGKQGDAFPTDSVNTFTTVSTYPITNIAENAGVITFDVQGGGIPVILNIDSTYPEAESSRKILYNGQVVILRGKRIYDILGRQL